jgi:hypothetical protein
LKKAREKIVQAAKNGNTLAILLGTLGKEHLSIKDKACKKPLGGDKIFPSSLLTASGKDLLKPKVKGGKAAIENLYSKMIWTVRYAFIVKSLTSCLYLSILLKFMKMS